MEGNNYLYQAGNIQKTWKPAPWDRAHSTKKHKVKMLLQSIQWIRMKDEHLVLSNRIILPYWVLNNISNLHLEKLIYFRIEGES